MMKKIADLMKKHRETIVYIIVGVVVAAVNWGVYSLLTSVGGVDVNISNAISICCAFLLAFFLNKIVVFQKKEWKYDVVAKEFLAFFLSRLFTAVIEWGTVPVMQLLKIDFDLFGIEAGFAKLTGSVLGTVLNYFLSKFIVFRKKKTDALTVLVPFLLVLFIPINAEASIKSEALYGPVPIVAEADAGGSPYFLKTSVVDTVNYLFLPSNTDLSSVKIYYTGEIALYNPYTKQAVSYGESTLMMLKRGENYIYEYDKETDKYYKYALYVYAGENINSVYIDLSKGDGGLIAINSENNGKRYTDSGVMRIVSSENEMIYDGNIEKISGHGNSSYNASGEQNTKNSYNVKLEKKAELVEGAGKSKKWVLLTGRSDVMAFDATGLAQMLGYYTYSGMVKGDSGYANVSAEFVDVFINGEYRGVYLLANKVDNKSAVNVKKSEIEYETDPKIVYVYDTNTEDELIQKGIKYYQYLRPSEKGTDIDDITGGYVLELTSVLSGEDGWFKTAHDVYVRVKYPENASKAQVKYIAGYVQEFEDALYSETGYNSLGKHYSEYADMNSLAAQMLVYGFYENWEYNRTSTYIYKDSDSSENNKLTFGPAWDFETDNNYYYYGSMFTSVFYTEEHYFTWTEQFWKHSDFMEYALAENEDMKKVHSVLLEKYSGNKMFVLNDMAESIALSQEMNWLRWNLDRSFTSLASDMETALNYRFDKWYNEFWSPKKYLLSVEVKCKPSGQGYKLSAKAKGVNNNDFVWYKISDEDLTQCSIAGYGKNITVSERGKYFCSVSGPNNAYSSLCEGEVFGNKTLTMKSGICDTEAKTNASVKAIEGTTLWAMHNGKPSILYILTGESKDTIYMVYYALIVIATLTVCIFAARGKKQRYKR